MNALPRYVTTKEMPAWYRSMLADCANCDGHGMIDPVPHPSSGEYAYACPECNGEGCVARLPLGDRLWRNAKRRDPLWARHYLRARALMRSVRHG